MRTVTEENTESINQTALHLKLLNKLGDTCTHLIFTFLVDRTAKKLAENKERQLKFQGPCKYNPVRATA